MSEQEPKGFKVIDKRGRPDEEREQPAPPPPAAPSPGAPSKDAGNPQGAGVVQGEKGPEGEPSAVGGPTFLDLVGMLQFGAMAHLGMVQTPDGKRSPLDLPAAKDSIDILSVLREKTKGNLTPDEEQALGEGLYHLRMVYIAAVNAGQDAGGKKK